MSVADDYGRFFASPTTIRAACWPNTPDKFTDRQVSVFMAELTGGERPLIFTYESGGLKYIQFDNFGQQTRAKSKFPEPPTVDAEIPDKHNETGCLSDAKQMLSKCEANAQPSRSRISESESYSESDAKSLKTSSEEVIPFPTQPPNEEEYIRAAALRMIQRHPVKRRCSLTEAAKRLKAILGKLPKPERLRKLEQIESYHAGWCECEDWQKEDEKYAKGLANWLAPTEGRYELQPPARASPNLFSGLTPKSQIVLDQLRRMHE
jgi:hypothetical protein